MQTSHTENSASNEAVNKPETCEAQDTGTTANPTTETPADPLIQMAEKLKEAENKYLYLYADFENYKKRSIKERSDWIKFGWENVAKDLLEVLDNFERALAHLPESTDTNLKSGLEMVSKHFFSVLNKQKVEPITTQGKFNPELHEALSILPSETVPNGEIIETVSKGYTLHGRLLRAAKVVVSAGPKS